MSNEADIIYDMLHGSLPWAGAEKQEPADIGLARQRLIVHLLQKLQMTPAKFYATCAQLVKCGILTKQVFSEMGAGARSQPQLTNGCAEDFSHETFFGARCSSKPRVPCDNIKTLSSRFEEDFQRLELLGRGAFGEVWRCRHRLDGQEYAVKMVEYHSSLDDAAQVERRALREAQTIAGISHANVVRYHNAWVEVDWNHLASPSSSCFALEPLPAVQVDSEDSADVAHSTQGYSDSEFSEGGVVFRDSSSAQDPGAVHEAVCEPETPEKDADLGVVERDRHIRKNPGSYKATLYIQTELCSKDTLTSWIQQRNATVKAGASGKEIQMWAQQAAAIFYQVVSVLAKMHVHKVVHRDLKPSNILFAADGTVRLGDFGLAKVLDERLAIEDSRTSGTPANLARTHSVGIGTASYASPEQLTGGSYNVKTDIHALGMILAELLCPVGTQMERAALFESLRSGNGVPEEIATSFPLSARLVAAMTDPNPRRRPSAKQLLKANKDLMLEVHTRFAIGTAVNPNLEAAAGSPHMQTFPIQRQTLQKHSRRRHGRAYAAVAESGMGDACQPQVQDRGRPRCRQWRSGSRTLRAHGEESSGSRCA
mmetsp:Transcript_9592/g.17204  ORF Transcript_9592/g.17204 Transcript_9592/m.17204 type:complete len:596 (+) Transcript_9592:92-1879(+)|eukprot:CAMPEP_0197664274 /NCGR_PEP_ID=MMETSP1338-20131121/58532_1 /TAXON_ID=43686 ORGANISM="Pelagodinium beii, Strain RCC1491" /NCGR_SAMPLE_ID=MMETSP1338 /ASSEMBLY_ACC=CAM_ASM_000754 /LENGTH=595 /DNA_ID=CAMNT_0043242877 /DNA_START=88 /DNA_END=1875 /DNA_ORIENTATION=+